MSTSTARPPSRTARGLTALAAVLGAFGALLVPGPAPAGAATGAYTATGRVSVTSSGAQKAQEVGGVVAVSADGRHVAFTTTAALVAADGNGGSDVYLRDRLGGTTTLVSLTHDEEVVADGTAVLCAMSRDARFVAFVATGDNLPHSLTHQIYVRDRTAGTTTVASLSSDGTPSNAGIGSGIFPGDRCALSDDGRYVAFASEDGTLAPHGSADGDVYRRDVQQQTSSPATPTASRTCS